MELEKVIEERFSVRKFSKKKVAQDKLSWAIVNYHTLLGKPKKKMYYNILINFCFGEIFLRFVFYI